MTQSMNYQRSNRLLVQKFIQYLFPTMLTTAALSLNEFVDSMLVSRLLGSDAMAIVNLGYPIVMLLACVYTLLGNGGATLYAVSIGQREQEKAGKCLRLSIMTAAIVGIAFLMIGFVGFEPIVNLLCSEASLLPDFRNYLRVLLISAPFLTIILTFVEFLPPSGMPAFATAINLVANGVNIVMDYVYIRFLHMGVEGAAWATLTGYIVGAVLILVILKFKRRNLYQAKTGKNDIALIKEIIGLGGPSAVSQLGFSLKFAFCNGLAVAYGGTIGVVCFSLCTQTLSVVSIFLAAIVGASMPLIAVLHGQRDFKGETGIVKTAMKYQLIVSILCCLAFEVFPAQVAGLYNITEAAEVELAVKAIRIFALMYLFRGTYMVFMKYLQVLGRKTFSMFISLFDGFVGIIPIGFVLCRVMGINGLWWAYVMTSVVLLVIVFLWNRQIVKKSEGRLSGFFLEGKEDLAERVFDVTILEETQQISGVSEHLMQLCVEHGIDKRTAMKTAVAVEEMAVYTRNRIHRKDYMDILARVYEDRVEIDFRSLGDSFNPLVPAEDDMPENISLLQKFTTKLEYNYIMGMNCTRIMIERNKTA